MKVAFIFFLSVLFHLPAFAADAEKVVQLANLGISAELKLYKIAVPDCGNNIEAIKLKLTGASVLLQQLGLHFSDGSDRLFPLNRTFPGNQESKWIAFTPLRNMDPRCPTHLFATAQALDGGQSRLEIFGKMKQ